MGYVGVKISLLFSLILSLLGIAGNYIQLDTTSFDFNFKTRYDINPLIGYLNIKNIGSFEARFDVISDASWLSVYREGQPTNNSVKIPPEYALRFVLEADTKDQKDGQHKGIITINAINLDDFSVLDSKTVNITLNKNYVPAPAVTQIPSVSVTPVATTITPSAVVEISPPVSTLPTNTPLKSAVPSIIISPFQPAKSEPTKLISPYVFPEASRQAGTPSVMAKSIWRIIADWFSRIF